MPTVLSLCDRTGNMVRPWLEAGYEAVTVDLQDAEPEAGRRHIVCDVRNVRDLLPADPVIVFAFPPCTDMAVSGARWFRNKGLRSLISALKIVETCRDIGETSGAPWMIENPVSTLATYWRDPDFIFDPCDYGDTYTKRTCLWIGGGFVMPAKVNFGDLFEVPTTVAPKLGSIIHRMPPSSDRGDKRAVTPMGFARAVFFANAQKLLVNEGESSTARANRE